jgi:hypothetical protein
MNNTNFTDPQIKSANRMDLSIKGYTRFGVALLAPPFILWVAVITFIFDQTLGEYVFSMFTPKSLEVTFFIAGMIFPCAAISVAAWGLQRRQDIAVNVFVLLLGVLFLTLVAIQMFT